MTMTCRERVEAALYHREPDRTPVFEYVIHSCLAEQFLGRPYAADPEIFRDMVSEKGWEWSVRQSAVDQLELACLLGHDMVYVIPNPLPPESQKKEPVAPESLPEDPVEHVRYRNRKRAASDFRSRDENFFVYSFLKEQMHRRSIDLPILAPAYAHGVWTDVELMQTMLLAPEVAREHFHLATRGLLGTIDKYVKVGVHQVGVGGDFAGNLPLISPESYREFILPEIRTLSRHIHEAGLWATNTSDGNLWSVIEDFLIGSEVDGYLEIDMHAGMDLRRLKELYGDRITLYGNLDCGNILSFGTPDDVKRHTIACLEAGMGDGGHILTASNAITSSVPMKNYLAIIEAYRDMFGLPRLSI